MAYATIKKGLKLPAGKGFVLKNTHVLIAGQVGITGSMKAGYVDDSLEEDCLYSGDPDEVATAVNAVIQKGQKWNSRTFNRRNRVVRRVIFRNARLEHGDYASRSGNTLFEDCIFETNGSQGNQDAPREIDLIGGLGDNVKCLVQFIRCKFIRNATPFGTRQSWASSMFAFDMNLRQWYPDGPLVLDANGNPQKGHLVRSLTDLEYINCEFIGDGYPHTASGNRSCNSTGAILCQDRENLLIRRCSFDFDRPDREIIQIRNTQNAELENLLFKRDGDIVLHHMDHCNANITPGVGPGEIRRRILGSHTTTPLSTIVAGYHS